LFNAVPSPTLDLRDAADNFSKNTTRRRTEFSIMAISSRMPQGIYRSLALDIRSSWASLTEQDLCEVQSTSDLAAKVATIYGVPLPQALHDVQAWAQGRRL
jgi:hypothetical protein